MDHFKILPAEITLDILSRLPTESVLHCELVCTDWRNLVRHPSFSKMHLHHLLNHLVSHSGKLSFIASNAYKKPKFYYFEYNQNHGQTTTPIERITRYNLTSPLESSSLVGSINGLICIAPFWFEAQPWICNPITKEYVELPKINCENFQYTCCSFGFGYVSSSDEYKVVGVHMFETTRIVQVHVYTLGSGNGWRNIGNFNFGTYKDWGEGIFANGFLYWLCSESKMIIAFDLAEEKFSDSISPPPLPPDSTWNENTIGVLDGCLFYSAYLDLEEDECYDVWILRMKNDDVDMKERKEHQSFVWCKEFRVDNSQLFAVTKTNNVLTYIDNYINIYNTKISTRKRLVVLKDDIWGVFLHMNTLVSLKEIGEKGTKIMDKETESRDKPSVIRR